MALTVVTSPTVEPVSLDEAKAHLRVDVEDENDQIRALITAARQYIETFTGRALCTQTWDLKLDAFPCSDTLWLRKPPVSSVTSITYLDTANVSQTWSASNYLTDLPAGEQATFARITPAYGVVWPSTYSVINAVTVRFVCGYGATGATVPEGLRQAMKLMIGHLYGFREPAMAGTTVTPIPTALDAVLWPFVVGA